jgi:hypothetical protein
MLLNFSYIPSPVITEFSQGQYASVGGSGRMAYPNRARKIADGTYVCWISYGSQDLTMSYCPGAPNPADYSDFVIGAPFSVA